MKEVLLALLFLCLPPLAMLNAAENGPYRVVHVVDGDTFDATDGHITFRVRIAAMDAPESHQRYGKWATGELTRLIDGKEITIHPVGRGLDRYNRVLGQVFVSGQDVSLVMIDGGFATYYRPHCRDFPEDKSLYQYDPRPYVEAEEKARSKHLVIWSDQDTELPCRFRKEHPWK